MRINEARHRIEERADLNAFISLTDETDCGFVVAVKDLIDVRGAVTTGGGAILPNIPAQADADAVMNVRSSGGAVVGKTNLHEWAFGVSSINPHYGAVRNPADPSRIAGGSSGGSAAAVAAGMCDWALGSDTGGSIRIPAALCGVVGFKPSVGLVSNKGLFPLSPTLDTIGPLARTVEDAAQALACIKGQAEPGAGMGHGASDFRIGALSSWVFDLDETVDGAWSQISAALPAIDFPARDTVVAAMPTILHYEAAQVHRTWLETVPDQYGEDVLVLFRKGLGISHQDYRNALATRQHVIDCVAEAMDGWDAVLLPATACVAPPITAPLREELIRFTRPFSLTGQPVITLPAPSPGLPVGIQVIGHRGRDNELIAVARALEAAWRPARAGSQ